MIADDIVNDLFADARQQCARVGAAASRDVRTIEEKRREAAAQPQAATAEADLANDDAASLRDSEALQGQVETFNKTVNAILTKCTPLFSAEVAVEDLPRRKQAFQYFIAALDVLETARQKLSALWSTYTASCEHVFVPLLQALLAEGLRAWVAQRRAVGWVSPTDDDGLADALEDLRTLLSTAAARKLEESLWRTLDDLDESLGAVDGALSEAPLLLGVPSLPRFALLGSALHAERVLVARLTDFDEHLTRLLLRGGGASDETRADPLHFSRGRSLAALLQAVVPMCRADRDKRRRLLSFLRFEYSPQLLRACHKATPRSVVGRGARDAAEVLHEAVYLPLRRTLSPFVDAVAPTDAAAADTAIASTLRTILYRLLLVVAKLREQSVSGGTLAGSGSGVIGMAARGGPIGDAAPRLSVDLVEDAALQRGLLTGMADFRSPAGHQVYFMHAPGDTHHRRAVHFYVEGATLFWKARGHREFTAASSVKALLSHCTGSS